MSNPYTAPGFTHDQIGVVQLFDTAVLAAVARGALDLNLIARQALASRGLDHNGVWVGFAAARALI